MALQIHCQWCHESIMELPESGEDMNKISTTIREHEDRCEKNVRRQEFDRWFAEKFPVNRKSDNERKRDRFSAAEREEAEWIFTYLHSEKERQRVLDFFRKIGLH